MDGTNGDCIMTYLEILLELTLMAVLFVMHVSFTTLETVIEQQQSVNAQLKSENAELEATSRMLGIVPALPA